MLIEFFRRYKGHRVDRVRSRYARYLLLSLPCVLHTLFSSGVDTTILDAFTQVYQRAAGEYPKKDFSVVYNAINPPEKN